ncbi:DUF397 domain-containing protein [Embleya sp. NBC_00896]|uniref:DUF397 domain-containing protein n=1 Tax=Embleya sp. NBC_00896 TaxID=2975961 RepID=UPI0038701D39|nr:DUF397 domain-containing protein [Embleya sp. NBC_00896]
MSSEARLRWRKSRYSTQDTDCVEIAPNREAVQARDSKVASSPVLGFGKMPWARFVSALK